MLLYCLRPPLTCLLALASYPQHSLPLPLTQPHANWAAVEAACSTRSVLGPVRSLDTAQPALHGTAARTSNPAQPLKLHSVVRWTLFLAVAGRMVSVQHCRKKEKGMDPERSFLLLLALTSPVQVAVLTLILTLSLTLTLSQVCMVVWVFGRSLHRCCFVCPSVTWIEQYLLLHSQRDKVSSMLHVQTRQAAVLQMHTFTGIW